jgi:c-di-GMP-binding flagellar brake protein YcgR
MANRQPTMRIERRRHLRAELEVPILLELTSSWQRARCNEISPGGLHILGTRDSLVPCQQLELYLELPTCVAIEAHAEVVRQDSTGIALRFVGLAPEQRIAIKRFCALRARGMSERIQPDPLYTSVA